MNVDDVGTFRFCPACALPIGKSLTNAEDPGHDDCDLREVRCSGCDRPWIACPCEPAK